MPNYGTSYNSNNSLRVKVTNSLLRNGDININNTMMNMKLNNMNSGTGSGLNVGNNVNTSHTLSSLCGDDDPLMCVNRHHPYMTGPRRRNTDPNRPKRPTSAYFYFAQVERDEAAKRGERINRGQVADWTKQISAKWRLLNDQEKHQFKVLAQEDKLRYNNEMAAYTGRDANRPKRPQSAYFLWLADFRIKVKDKFHVHKDILRAAGEEWRKMTIEDKAPYEVLAEEERKKYDARIKEYNQVREQVNDAKRMKIECSPTSSVSSHGGGGNNSNNNSDKNLNNLNNNNDLPKIADGDKQMEEACINGEDKVISNNNNNNNIVSNNNVNNNNNNDAVVLSRNATIVHTNGNNNVICNNNNNISDNKSLLSPAIATTSINNNNNNFDISTFISTANNNPNNNTMPAHFTSGFLMDPQQQQQQQPPPPQQQHFDYQQIYQQPFPYLPQRIYFQQQQQQQQQNSLHFPHDSHLYHHHHHHHRSNSNNNDDDNNNDNNN